MVAAWKPITASRKASLVYCPALFGNGSMYSSSRPEKEVRKSCQCLPTSFIRRLLSFKDLFAGVGLRGVALPPTVGSMFAGE
jgi:hypothetical protein